MSLGFVRSRGVLLAVGLAPMAFGCNRPSGGAAGGATAPAGKTTYIADVPVPADFVINEQISKNIVLPNIRIVDHVYEGPGSAQAVRNFYVNEMKNQQWRPDAETLDEAEYCLSYVKGLERCEVRIKRGGTGSLFRPIQIKVKIRPQQESGAKSP